MRMSERPHPGRLTRALVLGLAYRLAAGRGREARACPRKGYLWLRDGVATYVWPANACSAGEKWLDKPRMRLCSTDEPDSA